MPYFQIVFHGTGIKLAVKHSDIPIVGFFTTRIVWASDPEAAVDIGLRQVLTDWGGDAEYGASNGGLFPSITADEISPVGFFSGLLKTKRFGYSFYLDGDPDEL